MWNRPTGEPDVVGVAAGAASLFAPASRNVRHAGVWLRARMSGGDISVIVRSCVAKRCTQPRKWVWWRTAAAAAPSLRATHEPEAISVSLFAPATRSVRHAGVRCVQRMSRRRYQRHCSLLRRETLHAAAQGGLVARSTQPLKGAGGAQHAAAQGGLVAHSSRGAVAACNA